MAYLSTLGSPGVEVHEKDASQRISLSSGTTVFVPGYAAHGPVDEINPISSIEDFENIYGTPTNDAEYYFYYTVLALLNNAGNVTNVLVSRLPYGNDEGDTVSDAFSMLVYPYVPMAKSKSAAAASISYTSYPVTIAAASATPATVSAEDEVQTIQEIPVNFYIPVTVNDVFSAIDANASHLEITLDPSFGSKIITGLHVKDNAGNDTGAFKTCGIAMYVDDVLLETASDRMVIGVEVINEASKKIKVTVSAPLLNENSQVMGTFFGYIVGTAYDTTAEALNNVETNLVLINGSSQEVESHSPYGAYIKSVDLLETGDTPEEYSIKRSFIISAEETDKPISPNGEFNNSDLMVIGGTPLNPASYSPQTDITAVSDVENITYFIGAPTIWQVSLSDYYSILTGEGIKWDTNWEAAINSTDVNKILNNAAFIVINSSRSTINNKLEGFYFGLTDNLFNEPKNGTKTGNTVNSWDKYNAVEHVKSTTKTCHSNINKSSGTVITQDDLTEISPGRLDFDCDGLNTGNISRVLQSDITQFDTSSETFDDTVSLALFKLTHSQTSTMISKLAYSVREKYNVSFGKSRIQGSSESTSPVSYFAESVMKDSANMTILVNPYISESIKVNATGNLFGKIRIVSEKLHSNLKRIYANYSAAQSIAGNETQTISDLMTPAKAAALDNEQYKTECARIGVDLATYESYFTGDNAKLKPVDAIYPLAVYNGEVANNNIIGNVPAKLDRVLTIIENDEDYPDIDILCEAGLGTIYAYTNSNKIESDNTTATTVSNENGILVAQDESNHLLNPVFDDSIIIQGIEDLRTGRSSLTSDAQTVIDNYTAVQNSFLNIANSYVKGGRNDTFFISDTLRGILLKGKNTKVEKMYGQPIINNAYQNTDEKPNHSWSTSIYWPHKHLFDSITSSYASTYAQWVKVNNKFNNETTWVPVSGYIAAIMSSTDALYGPWYAAAGINRGIIEGILDCAVSPTTKQRSDLYKLCVNSVPKLSGIGITIWGIRTLSKIASAMDQNTCRRTLLQIIKTVKRYLRYYVFEPNTAFTRLSCYNDIDPYLSDLVAKGAIYAYSLECSTANNTPEVINNGEMAVDISVQPTRTAENIVLTVTANKYTQDISTSTLNA